MTVRHLLLRLLHAVVTVWATFTLSFALLYLLPGDPVAIMLSGQGGVANTTPEQVRQLRAAYGFERPLPEQYADRLWAALHGDLGRSVGSGDTVVHTFATALPQTLALAGVGLALAVLLGVGTALAAVATRSRRLSRLLLSAPSLGVSFPQFVVGLVLLEVVSFRWKLLPAFGHTGGSGLVLPAITLAIPTASVIAQVFARSLADVLLSPYVATARAKGAGRARVLLLHATRNAALPLLSLLGLIIGSLLAGSVVVETVFSRDGFGRITAAAVEAQDIPVVQGAVVVSALVFAAVSLAVDLVTPLLDPRLAERPATGRGSRGWLRPQSA
ncbi:MULTISPECIES: ABC transporter permease [Protofrankia]|uniref:Peptide ABC transporter permease n=1 Tax=Protofrankia coriariae TaxID=1562887 RepID=A0ABR5F0X9_9ACTN|nr:MULTISPECIES: ABC transporter permease [Protofrankia]KLL10376.1 peptide ABC transporter permease [Protofrankia coriariae]ONH33512.1 peptide ABC transporter permease [Protofrankia sp. BMG5.30]